MKRRKGRLTMSNARQQQLMLAVRLLLGLLLGAWGGQHWGPPGGLLMAWTGVFGWTLLVLPVFLLLRRLPRPEGQPQPSVAQCLRAAGREWWAYEKVFSWQQPFGEKRSPDRCDASHAGCRGVLLLHGFRCNRGLWQHWERRLDAQGLPHVSLSLEPPFASIDAYAEQIELAIRRLEEVTGLPPVVVAHSMGGLALRAWRRAVGAAPGRVHHVITLGTPHAGTLMAQLSGAPNARQMRARSSWLQTLAESESADWWRRFTCVYSCCDQVVCPSVLAVLPEAQTLVVPASGHLQLVFEPMVLDAVLRRLTAD
ncbi:alpha/beta fold hydrolase [Mitsuaria sp. WAJ17]|uniref:alpha/beta fold hydrolase n=1 Tax=Mitsuaria sp. WAJ17 TaxID=2761452 RepID=UPI00160378F2|nr:alpha/beta fold hydrolase [Mitsuaria sp. WAJ17]MBB2488033.1 alpha/beta fold hydrolase [Mitsuaria sp. WAJ17]